MPSLAVESPADPASTTAVFDGLKSFNARHAMGGERARFNVVLRDDGNAVVGGCVCEVRWHWLYVDLLWVADAYRGHGHGSHLLAEAETEARRRGCTKAHLDTVSFQARPFYEKLGWSLFGTLDDHPPGHARYFLQKDISHTS